MSKLTHEREAQIRKDQNQGFMYVEDLLAEIDYTRNELSKALKENNAALHTELGLLEQNSKYLQDQIRFLRIIYCLRNVLSQYVLGDENRGLDDGGELGRRALDETRLGKEEDE